jgi:hypothetical protein
MKEMILIFGKITNQKAFLQGLRGEDFFDHLDQSFLINVLKILYSTSGTEDPGWFSLAESYLNIIFDLRMKSAMSMA